MTGAAGEPESLVQRAIESVLEQVPNLGDQVNLEESAKYQPWAEKLAPASKNKRPLSELLAEFAARIAADPEAVAGAPAAKHPVVAFFDRFGAPRRQGGRRRGRGGRGGGQVAAGAAQPPPSPPSSSGSGHPTPPPSRPRAGAQPAAGAAVPLAGAVAVAAVAGAAARGHHQCSRSFAASPAAS